MPAFCEAPSTLYYFECERALFESYFPQLAGKRVLKTDLWDEAKNSRILHWAADRGARAYGLDISFETLAAARAVFHDCAERHRTGFIVSDVRKIGFADNSFEYLYSMGTVEHSPEYYAGLQECFRVLKRGGRAIIGVPNKLDPFLRPLLVALLSRLRLYAYGYELSFTARHLNRLLEQVGFKVVANTGILFMPGVLRMLDLYFFCYCPWGTRLTAPLIAPFAFLYRRFPRLRRHGYLIAAVVEKP
ncbi:MAG TPA: class I SAM-dependent methyltransferase [Candidatus Acidoferrales bacterium]|nr:class I SAM-dependent methyltransferase [Candidatus Acidoferrales bacterium]